jgi:hypothetical protein
MISSERASAIARSCPEGQSGIEFDDAGAFGRQPQFLFAAQHAETLLAADLRLFDDEVSREDGARRGQCDGKSGAAVRRPADDGELFGARVDASKLKFVGIGVPPGIEHAGHHDARERDRSRLDLLDLEARKRQTTGDLRGIPVHLDETPQPVHADFHGRLRRKGRVGVSQRVGN